MKTICKINKKTCCGYHKGDCISIENCKNKKTIYTHYENIMNYDKDEMLIFINTLRIEGYLSGLRQDQALKVFDSKWLDEYE